MGREEAWAAEALGCVEIEVMATCPLGWEARARTCGVCVLG